MMLNPDARNYYGKPVAVCPCDDAEDVESALRLIKRMAQTKDGERLVIALFKAKKGGEDG